jgi:ferredoxin
MKKYKITIHQDECIACGNCYTVDPIHFKVNDDNFAAVTNGFIENGYSVGSFYDDKIDQARDAEDACPVSVIEIEEV